MILNVKNRILSFWHRYNKFAGAKAVSVLEWETAELEHIFAISTLGLFIGLPAPPTQITFDLLPDMENEFTLLINKIDSSHAPLSDLFSILDVS
ncbi:MAG: hypothetical protein JW956_06195 [Calditrichaceae bacterium]|nr:hypothetical protein [Calditrichaceae bacterium]